MGSVVKILEEVRLPFYRLLASLSAHELVPVLNAEIKTEDWRLTSHEYTRRTMALS
jgi:hypothetical protein